MKLYRIYDSTYRPSSEDKKPDAYVAATDSATALDIFTDEYGDSGHYYISLETLPLFIEGKQ